MSDWVDVVATQTGFRGGVRVRPGTKLRVRSGESLPKWLVPAATAPAEPKESLIEKEARERREAKRAAVQRQIEEQNRKAKEALKGPEGEKPPKKTADPATDLFD